MNAVTTEPVVNQQRSVIGRHAMVQDHKREGRVFVGALVIDAIAGVNRSKRVRLQTGPHAGDVRGLGEYTLIEFTD